MKTQSGFAAAMGITSMLT
ncbi:unnamed protein product [Victoria cruziana]